MTGKEFWGAAGLLAPLKGCFQFFIFLVLQCGAASSFQKESAASLILQDLVQAVSLNSQTPTSLLTSKKEKFFPNLEERHVDSAFYADCETFVSECTQGKMVYLNSFVQTEALNTAKPTVRLLEGNVAYLYLPAPYVASSQKNAYIRFVRKIVRRLGRRSLKGWIIDLRDCSGYDSKTLLAGCVDLFRDGILGFIDYEKDSVIKDFFKKEGKLFFHDDLLSGGGRLPRRFVPFPSKIAVLQGQETKGAGESLVLSLKSQRVTKSFGQPTSGDLQYYEIFSLNRGGYLLVQKGHFLDHTGRYPVLGIQPDQYIADFNKEKDETLNQALSWVLE